jgi:predicted amidohydrolase
MVPKIAISQAPYQRDTPFCLNRALDQMRQARQLGADILVFPEWFLGLNPPEALPSRQTDALAQTARALALAVVCGTLRTLDPKTGLRRQEALMIDMDGKIVGRQAKCDMDPPERPWFEPGERLTVIPTRFGRLAILLGPDAHSSSRWAECRELFPDVVFLLTGARSPREAEALRAMTLDRSREIGGTVVLAPLTGRFGGVMYVPCALAAHRGRIVAAPGPEDAVGLAALAAPTLIQLGAVDAAAQAAEDGGDNVGREPERRVLVDWHALQASDLLAAGRRLLAAAYDSPRQTALAPVHPDHPEVLEALLAEGARGGMAWPAALRTYAYESRYRDAVSLLARQGKPLVARVGESPAPLRFSAPSDWDDWLVQYADWPVVLCLAGLHRPFWEEALTLAALRPNVYLLTGPLSPERLEEAVHRVGPDRLVFGTGGATGFAAAWEALDQLRQKAALEADAFSQVAGGNARRLFFRDSEPSLMARPEQE